MSINVSLRKLRICLVGMWAFNVVAGFCVEAWKYILRQPRNSLVYFFGLSYEQNFPTWYVASLLLLCSVVLGLIACAKQRRKAPYVGHWWTLAAAFLYISLDETTEIHEHGSDWFDLGGFLYFGWVVPASIVVAVLGRSYLKFLIHLPRKTRNQFILAGAVYVGGALGVEFFLGYWTDLHGRRNLGYGLIDWVQESMELFGVSWFLCSLTEYLGGPVGRIRISLFDAAESVVRPVSQLDSRGRAESFTPANPVARPELAGLCS